MRIIKEKTLVELFEKKSYKNIEPALRSWIYEVRHSDWNSPAELKAKYGSASIISAKRVVFNIKGNAYRLVVDIEYKLKIVFIVWFGTHQEYGKIDINTVRYDN